MPSDREVEELTEAQLLTAATKVKPAKSTGKKGKKFADRDFMLRTINDVNLAQEGKLQELAERESEALKFMAQKLKRKAEKKKKETNGEKVAKMKEKLRSRRQDSAGGKSSASANKRDDPPKNDKRKNSKAVQSRPKKIGGKEKGSKPSKKVSFK